MAQWNKNTVPKCEDKTCSDEVLVTVEKYCRGTYKMLSLFDELTKESNKDK